MNTYAAQGRHSKATTASRFVAILTIRIARLSDLSLAEDEVSFLGSFKTEYGSCHYQPMPQISTKQGTRYQPSHPSSLLPPATLVFPLICCLCLCSRYLALALGLDVGYYVLVYEKISGASIGVPLKFSHNLGARLWLGWHWHIYYALNCRLTMTLTLG
jgi:hypothetical protein